MCFDLDSAPPIPPISGAAVSHDDLVLQSSDGNRFAAFHATPDEPATTGVVVLPDVRGLYRFYEELALRFAERGYPALAFDYFGRTAGTEKRDDDFEYMPHVQQTTPGGVQADVAACVQHLHANGVTLSSRSASASAGGTRGSPQRVGMTSPERSGSTGGRGPANDGTPGPIQRGRGRCGADPRAPGRRRPRDPGRGLAGVRSSALRGRGRARGRDLRGSPHSFFDRKYEEFAADSEDAWNRVLAFLARYA
jgi:carboxymethylenebutenolidase